MSGLEGLLAGRVLVNRYRIEEVVGRGGFAAVYRADDLRLGRAVAVKVITLSAGDPALRDSLRERFQREARAAAGLPHHPNLVAVHDFGTDAELDLDFLVMELLRGEDLATYLAGQPRPPMELAMAMLVDAGEGLAVGHRAGLVHRDVKPGNLFLAEPHGGEPFRVCVLDYGIARLREEEQTRTRLTQEGSAPLSPAYASPEQLRGEMDLSPASDVFSLGVVGYQLLTGERPFGAERRGRRQGEAEPVRPVRELAPDVPAPVAAVIARALADRPEDRFADAGEMAAALSAAVRAPSSDDGDATVAAPPVLVAAPRSAPPPPDDDATLIQAPAARPPTPTSYPAPVRQATPPPPPRRRGMGGVLLGLLVLVGLAFGGWMLFAGEDDGARPTVAGTVEGEDSVPPAEAETMVVPEAEAGGDGSAAAPAPEPGGTSAPAPMEGTSPAPPAAGGTAAPAPQPQPSAPTAPAPAPGTPPVARPQPTPSQPLPQPQPQPTRPRPTPPAPQPQPTPPSTPQPQPPPQPLPPAPQPLPPAPEPLPPPVIPQPRPAPRDTIRIRPLPGRPVPDAPAAPTR